MEKRPRQNGGARASMGRGEEQQKPLSPRPPVRASLLEGSMGSRWRREGTA